MKFFIVVQLMFVTLVCPAIAAPPTTAPAKATKDFVLHLPGVGGELTPDRRLVRGLGLAGVEKVVIYDWTENDPGLAALVSMKRNRAEAAKVAEMIVQQITQQPDTRLHLVSHSGGTGVAAWALEGLPDNVHVYSWTLIASALSPTYDLSKALRHVDHKAYAFTSLNDTAVLSVGTKIFGTIDGVMVEAAGYSGFVIPKDADKEQYKKLRQFPYDPLWMKFNNLGEHIGAMNTLFARDVIGPLILNDAAPPTSPATQPALPAGAATVDGVNR